MAYAGRMWRRLQAVERWVFRVTLVAIVLGGCGMTARMLAPVRWWPRTVGHAVPHRDGRGCEYEFCHYSWFSISCGRGPMACGDMRFPYRGTPVFCDCSSSPDAGR